jgi:hypothetical protein
MTLTNRLALRIRHDFPACAEDVGMLVADAGESERVHAAIVLAARGRLDALHDAISLARLDWRDLLVGVGLAHADWADKLDVLLGPEAGKAPERAPLTEDNE